MRGREAGERSVFHTRYSHDSSCGTHFPSVEAYLFKNAIPSSQSTHRIECKQV